MKRRVYLKAGCSAFIGILTGCSTIDELNAADDGADRDNNTMTPDSTPDSSPTPTATPTPDDSSGDGDDEENSDGTEENKEEERLLADIEAEVVEIPPVKIIPQWATFRPAFDEEVPNYSQTALIDEFEFYVEYQLEFLGDEMCNPEFSFVNELYTKDRSETFSWEYTTQWELAFQEVEGEGSKTFSPDIPREELEDAEGRGTAAQMLADYRVTGTHLDSYTCPDMEDTVEALRLELTNLKDFSFKVPLTVKIITDSSTTTVEVNQRILRGVNTIWIPIQDTELADEALALSTGNYEAEVALSNPAIRNIELVDVEIVEGRKRGWRIIFRNRGEEPIRMSFAPGFNQDPSRRLGGSDLKHTPAIQANSMTKEIPPGENMPFTYKNLPPNNSYQYPVRGWYFRKPVTIEE